jgi:hypothetical protein
MFLNNCYESSLTGYNGQAGAADKAKFQLALTGAINVFTMSNIRLYGGGYQFAMYGGSVDWTSGWLQTEADTIEAIRVFGAGGTVFTGRGLAVSAESGGASLVYDAEFSGLDQVNIYDSTFESPVRVPAFWFNGNLSVTLTNQRFTGSIGSANGLMRITNTANPIMLINPLNTDRVGAPYSDTMQMVSVSGSATNAAQTQCKINDGSSVNCGSAATGFFYLPPGITSLSINTSAVTANSKILIQQDSSIGTQLGVTCYRLGTTTPFVFSRAVGTSFTVSAAASTGNPACYAFNVLN